MPKKAKKQVDMTELSDFELLDLMTEKQKLFADRYLIHRNRSRAVLESHDTTLISVATKSAYLLLQKPHIKEYISRMQKEIQERMIMSVTDILHEYFKIARIDIRELFDENGTMLKPHQLPPEISSAIAEIQEDAYAIGEDGVKKTKTKYKLHNKLSALQDLGKHFGIFEKDNAQKTQSVNVFKYPDNKRDEREKEGE